MKELKKETSVRSHSGHILMSKELRDDLIDLPYGYDVWIDIMHKVKIFIMGIEEDENTVTYKCISPYFEKCTGFNKRYVFKMRKKLTDECAADSSLEPVFVFTFRFETADGKLIFDSEK